MAKIFVSHSQRDEDIKDLFLRAFRGTGVTDTYREYEDAPPTAEHIEQDIEFSNAVFVLLSETVQSLPHTTQWILYECGAAKGKPIWVFEPYESFGKITAITIPRFDHYVRYRNNDTWRKYIHSIVASYSDTPVLAKVGSTILGAMLGGGWGAFIGLLAGSALFPTSERPAGYNTRCPDCKRAFTVHLPDMRDAFRCPKCKFRALYLQAAFVPRNIY
jgi:DNA-directed RNA polymerase subunit RPC12/RpoP